MNKFCDELWRIVKFILITGLVNLVFTIANNVITNGLVASRSISVGQMLSMLSYAHTILTAIIAALLNRYFTFRATEKWYIAVPVMVIAALGWNWLTALPRMATSKLGMDAIMSMISLLGIAWYVVSYLLQRCVIYCHTIDTNGWYRRFHPTNEEGVYPNE